MLNKTNSISPGNDKSIPDNLYQQELVKKNINREVFNIIDDHNMNGELSCNHNLEESCSSYSKTIGFLKET